MIAPEAIDRMGMQTLVLTFQNQVAEDLHHHPVVSHHPNNGAMVNRGKIAKATFDKFVETISGTTTNEDVALLGSYPRNQSTNGQHPKLATIATEESVRAKGPHPGDDLTKLIREAVIKETRDIVSRLTSKIVSKQATLEDFRKQMPLARQLHSTLQPLETSLHLRHAAKTPTLQQDQARHQVAAIMNQQASVPGQHGVPFKKAGDAREPRAAASGTARGRQHP